MACIAPHTEKFNRILDFLRGELGLPNTLVGLTIRMKLDDVLRVTDMEYLPVEEHFNYLQGKDGDGI